MHSLIHSRCEQPEAVGKVGTATPAPAPTPAPTATQPPVATVTEPVRTVMLLRKSPRGPGIPIPLGPLANALGRVRRRGDGEALLATILQLANIPFA
jgi:hypothetical protein